MKFTPRSTARWSERIDSASSVVAPGVAADGPGAEADRGDLPAGAAERAVVHVVLEVGSRRSRTQLPLPVGRPIVDVALVHREAESDLQSISVNGLRSSDMCDGAAPKNVAYGVMEKFAFTRWSYPTPSCSRRAVPIGTWSPASLSLILVSRTPMPAPVSTKNPCVDAGIPLRDHGDRMSVTRTVGLGRRDAVP